MKKITRDQASQLLRKFGVTETKIERIKNALLVCTILSNNSALLVKYDVKNHHKSYFLESCKC